jgi:two-component system chemotaxis response regulator CheB
MIKVLVVDDSSFMRKSISYILKSDPEIDVAGAVDNGEEALRQVKVLHPDVVLLDIAMPQMDGLTALTHIMAQCPTPVLILSGLDKKDVSVILKSLQLGAVDYIQKPAGLISYDIDDIKNEIITKVHIAAKAKVSMIEQPVAAKSCANKKNKKKAKKKIVVIGASTGGPKAIAKVLSGITQKISAGILIIQHMSKEFTPFFSEQLKLECALNISEARDNDSICPGSVYVAPGGFQTGIFDDGVKKRIELSDMTLKMQSIDYTMRSAVKVYGGDIVGVLLTGMGSDGAEGLKAIKNAGGSTIAEDESTCVIFGMPRAAIELGCVDTVVPLPQVAETIMRMI